MTGAPTNANAENAKIHDNALRGVLFMCAGMFMGAAIDVSVKALTAGYGTPQIVLLRVLLALPLVLAICHQQNGLRSLATPRWGWQLYRGVLAAGANFGFFYALAYIELLTAMMLAYLSPVLIVLLARPLLGERVGIHQWIGILIAVAGVLIVLQPKGLDIEPAALSVLGSSLCWALLSLSNRRLAGIESPAVLTFYTLPVAGILAGLFTVGQWVTPTWLDWAYFAIAGVSGGCVHLFVAVAYKHAPAATIAPFEYTTLIWGALAGFLFWNEVPTQLIWIGGAAVITGGYIAMRS